MGKPGFFVRPKMSFQTAHSLCAAFPVYAARQRMQSLKDKLLSAGVVQSSDVERVESAKTSTPPAVARPRRADNVRAPAPAAVSGALPSRLPRFAPLVGSPQANREASRKQLALDRFLRDKIVNSQIHLEDGLTAFYFVTRKNKLRKMLLSEAQAEQIRAGVYAIVERPDPDKIDYAVVPAAVAGELLALSQRTVRFWNNPQSPIGFVSETDIATGAHETAADASEAPQESVEPSAGETETETFVTIKRLPLP
jgi:uncharacterized protein YaiL (DUF2058 family)